MRILFFGDIIGALGRKAVAATLPELKKKHAPDLVVANVENLAHGVGVTEKTLNELVTAGVDVFTGGNHSWDNPLGAPLFDREDWKSRIVVPTNYGAKKNGTNAIVIERHGARLLIINIIGQLFGHPQTRSPFEELDAVLKAHGDVRPNAILVDFHAEATAEKEAFGHYADGRVAAVLGTHTHIPTADAKILLGGAAYVTDVGRCGAYDSVIGFEKKSVIKRFLQGGSPKYILPESGQAEVNALLIDIDTEAGKARGLDRIREIVDIPAAKGYPEGEKSS